MLIRASIQLVHLIVKAFICLSSGDGGEGRPQTTLEAEGTSLRSSVSGGNQFLLAYMPCIDVNMVSVYEQDVHYLMSKNCEAKPPKSCAVFTLPPPGNIHAAQAYRHVHVISTLPSHDPPRGCCREV